MPDHPPPAPDWILGPDGHWRPPPFEIGRPTGPAPAPQQPPAVAFGAPPPGGPPPFGPPPGGYWPPPPPQHKGAGRSVAIALGIAGAGFFGLIVLCLLAVTFLGTTTSEPETVGLTPPLDGGSAGGSSDDADDWEPATTEGDAGEDDAPAADVPLSEAAATGIALELVAEGWAPRSGEPMPLDEPITECMPDGWHDGITDGFRAEFHADGIGDVHVASSAYTSDDAANADLARAASEEARACIESSAEEYSGVEVTTYALPADPTVPGVTFRSEAVLPDGPLVQDDVQVVVGRVRVHVSYCTCAALDESVRREVAQEVAVAIAGVQGMPPPG